MLSLYDCLSLSRLLSWMYSCLNTDAHVYLYDCLPTCLLVYLPTCLYVHLFTCLYAGVSVGLCMSGCLYVCLFACLPVFLFAWLYDCLSTCWLVCMYVFLPELLPSSLPSRHPSLLLSGHQSTWVRVAKWVECSTPILGDWGIRSSWVQVWILLFKTWSSQANAFNIYTCRFLDLALGIIRIGQKLVASV